MLGEKALPSEPGVYILVIRVTNDICVVTKAKTFNIRRGLYAYVGSALSGLRRRLTRYLRKPTRKHWHIDYLLEKASLLSVLYSLTENREVRPELELSRELEVLPLFEPVPGFGCSDLREVRSNLYRYKYEDYDSLLETLREVMTRLFGNVHEVNLMESTVDKSRTLKFQQEGGDEFPTNDRAKSG